MQNRRYITPPPKTTASFPRFIYSDGRALRFHFLYTRINHIFQAKDHLSFYLSLRTYNLMRVGYTQEIVSFTASNLILSSRDSSNQKHFLQKLLNSNCSTLLSSNKKGKLAFVYSSCELSLLPWTNYYCFGYAQQTQDIRIFFAYSTWRILLYHVEMNSQYLDPGE